MGQPKEFKMPGKGKMLMGKAPGKKPKPTPDPYFSDGLPPAEGFGGYGEDDKLVSKRPKKIAPKRSLIGPEIKLKGKTVTASTGQGLQFFRDKKNARVRTMGTRRGGK
jgi:hypothetical protein